MYKKFTAFLAIIVLVIVLNSCQQNNDADAQKNSTDAGGLPVTMDDSSKVIIDRAIAYAGGYDAWQQKNPSRMIRKAPVTIAQVRSYAKPTCIWII
jgi:hypothetical protein